MKIMRGADTRLLSLLLVLAAVAGTICAQGYLMRTNPRNIGSPPRFKLKPTLDVVAFVDRKHKFVCKVRGSPKPFLSWYHGNKLIGQSKRVKIGKYSLQISNLNKNDSGEYSCKAFNRYGILWGNFSLHVVQDEDKVNDPDQYEEKDNSFEDDFADLEGPPEFKKRLNQVGYLSRAATTSVDFNCDAIAYPAASITWWKNGQQVHKKGKYIIQDFMLTVKYLTLDDTGDYTCVVENEFGAVNWTTKLEVMQSIAIAPIMEDIKNQTALVGENVTFTCQIVMSDSQPLLQWLRHFKKNNSFVNEKGEPYVKRLQSSGFKSTIDDPQHLVLHNVTKEDQGWYTCLVANTYGINYKSAWLTVYNACVPADLGLADGRIGADHVTVSSQDPEYTKAEIGNENNKKGWCPSLTDKSPWVQLKLDQPKAVSLFKFMWSQKGGQTIMTEFELQYIAAVDSARQLRTFAKNIPAMNNTHIFQVTIDPVVVTDTIRIIPSNWDIRPCFKLEIQGCDPKALCSANFCLNGGTCMGENDCLCPSGFVGRRCELAANQIRETNITFVNKEHNMIVLVSGNGTSVEEGNITVETVNDSCIILRETSLTPSCLIDINYCNNGFTLAVDINFSHLLENTYIVSSGGNLPGYSGIALYYSNNQLHYIVSTTTQTWTVVVNYPPVLHTWQHFELTWNRHLGIEILVNGHSLGSNTQPSPKQASSNINNLSIVCSYTSNNSLVNMQVSEINFWSLDRTSLVNAGIKKPAVLQTTPMSVNMLSSTTLTGRPLTTETVLLETTTNAETTTSTKGQHWRFEDAIKADCSSTGWNISMDINILRLLYPGITDTDIYLGPEKCHGSRYDNVLWFQQTFDTCMTAEKDVDGTTLFQNTLFYAIFDPVDPSMVRRHVWTYSVACYLTKEETATAHLHHSVESHSTNITGHRDITLAFYRDQNFLHQITGNLLKVHVGDKIYVKVMTAIPDWNTKMRLHTCYTRPSYKTTQHFLITDGCEVDSSTHIISQSTHETKFVFQDFEYLTFDEGLDIFCSATFCDANDYSPECTQACRQGPSIIG